MNRRRSKIWILAYANTAILQTCNTRRYGVGQVMVEKLLVSCRYKVFGDFGVAFVVDLQCQFESRPEGIFQVGNSTH